MSHIIAVVEIGTVVRIQHDGHPHDGLIAQVSEKDHGVGGIGGGGVVWIQTVDEVRIPVSRYTRVDEI